MRKICWKSQRHAPENGSNSTCIPIWVRWMPPTTWRICRSSRQWGHKAIAITDHGGAQGSWCPSCRRKGWCFTCGSQYRGWRRSGCLQSSACSTDRCYLYRVDVETTGLSAAYDTIIELPLCGCIKANVASLMNLSIQVIRYRERP